ncbi:MAG: glutamate--tRNA ligase [Actinomyces succiniciruminis]|uniref:Glutamate--tRNA ligase n=1 Tax=Actinomyces succiniciruminis TaxID=1522002 RepID=A0A1L7RC79_9ACTO|nr:glutamate--tRNA ligase [Actinomyces succiniciruminis]MBE6474182.1 glutamate--tRNA ligase [Actinomyces succiniciruminis]CED91511.1 Glutamate--tRNA ligase [Actinomyces succiniciruminis]
MSDDTAKAPAFTPPAPGSSPIRVRFCPSPTGTPHVGMVRTCLFNWAYARHTGGTFVLRIEDTDAARDSEESFEAILDSLRWLGLDWDEGVAKGGPHAPYRQSQRTELYRQVADELLQAGYLYESFSTPAEIEARHRANGEDPKLGYDGYDRDLTEAQKAAFRAEGRRPVLRMRMPDEDITFHDLVRGPVTFKAGSVPDYVVVRAGGDPLYTLVNPVDDAAMGITHVLRGEDLLSSTPRQVVLYRALMEIGRAQRVPEFAHLPYVMGEGNKKLSKRDPESNLLIHRFRGMAPEGLLNYLALLGWSLSKDEDVFTPDQLVAAFDIRDVNPNPARFDPKKCEAINAEHLRRLEGEDFRNRLVPYLADVYPDPADPDWTARPLVSATTFAELTQREQEILTAAAPLIQTRIQLLRESRDMLGFLLVDDADLELEERAVSRLKDSAPQVLDTAIATLETLPEPWRTEVLEQALRAAIVDGMGIKPRLAFGPLRVAVTGRQVSPPLFESMEILGAEASLARLRALRARLG